MEKLYDILFHIRPDADFKESNDFIGDGYLDSFDIVNLVCELNEAFQIDINGMDIILDHFITIETISDLVVKSGGSL